LKPLMRVLAKLCELADVVLSNTRMTPSLLTSPLHVTPRAELCWGIARLQASEAAGLPSAPGHRCERLPCPPAARCRPRRETAAVGHGSRNTAWLIIRLIISHGPGRRPPRARGASRLLLPRRSPLHNSVMYKPSGGVRRLRELGGGLFGMQSALAQVGRFPAGIACAGSTEGVIDSQGSADPKTGDVQR